MEGNVQRTDMESAIGSLPEPLPELSPEPIPEPLDLGPAIEPEEVSPAEIIEEPEIIADPNDLSEISQFANADQALGALSYSITIENIDTKEVLTELLEALSDPKFQWDQAEIRKQARAGRVELKQVNPAKASVVIQRIGDLPVKVSWKQHIYA